MPAEIVNDFTGEAVLASDDGESKHGLLFDLRAIKEIETAEHRSIADLFMSWDSARPGVAELERLVLAASKGYQRQHPGETALTDKTVLDAIERSGRFTSVFLVVLRSVKTAWNGDDDDEDGDGADDAGPPGRGATP